MPRTPRLIALALLVAACGGSAPDPRAPSGLVHVKTIEDDYPEARVARDGDVTLFFGVVKHETPPPGFAPDPAPATDETERGRTKVKGKVPANASKVLTVEVVDGITPKVIGRIEHVDDSAPTFLELAGPERYPGRIWVPIVGPKGERLTQLYLTRYDANTERELLKIGTPIPRVMRFGYGDASDHHTKSKFVFALPAAEPGFVHPLDAEGKRIALPPGVVGVKPVTSRDASKEWSAWLVGWKGERGEGWSYDLAGHLENFADKGPRWTEVTTGQTRAARWMIGTLADGRCEAVVAELFTGVGAPPATKRTADSCEAALTTLDAELMAFKAARTKAKEDAAAAIAARAAADRAEKIRNEKAAYDRLVAENAEEQKAREAERPFLRQFLALADGADFAPACNAARRLRPRTHIELFGQRAGTVPQLRPEELSCVTGRTDLSRDDQIALDRARKILVEAQNATAREAAVRRPVGDWNPGSGSSGGPTAAERLKATHEYMYGSGRASTCPFTDRSLCK